MPKNCQVLKRLICIAYGYQQACVLYCALLSHYPSPNWRCQVDLTRCWLFLFFFFSPHHCQWCREWRHVKSSEATQNNVQPALCTTGSWPWAHPALPPSDSHNSPLDNSRMNDKSGMGERRKGDQYDCRTVAETTSYEGWINKSGPAWNKQPHVESLRICMARRTPPLALHLE